MKTLKSKSQHKENYYEIKRNNNEYLLSACFKPILL